MYWIQQCAQLLQQEVECASILQQCKSGSACESSRGATKSDELGNVQKNITTNKKRASRNGCGVVCCSFCVVT